MAKKPSKQIKEKPSTTRANKIEKIIQEIKTKFGDEAIMKLGEAKRVDVDAIPTGALSLDLAIGVSGYPRGRVIEVFGPESSGKTTLALHAVAEAQKQGGTAAFIDVEHALDPEYARHIGVNIDDLLISQPDTGEQALDIVETLVRSGSVDIIIIDSVAALTPRAEIEGEMGDQQVGLQARLMSKALRKITNVLAKSGTVIIFTNQIRMKIGIMFGNPETTPGGRALKFFSSVRLDIRRRAQLKSGDDIVGNRTHVKVVKNKVAAPFRTAEFDIMYNEGISRLGDILQTGARFDVIEKSGSWYSYKGEKLGQGIDSAKEYLKENPKLVSELTKEITKAVRESGRREKEQ